jgi:hypothetical protein
MKTIDSNKTKLQSEKKIINQGGQICDWLPFIECKPSHMRTVAQVRDRALVMNALINLAFEAPVDVVAEWIERHGLEKSLSKREQTILTKTQKKLSKQEKLDLHWYLESLWALMWAGSLVAKHDLTNGVPDSMVKLCPNLQKNEDGSKFQKLKLRPYEKLYAELDLAYRWHWYARNGQLTGKPTPPVELSVIMERRKALEWILDKKADWDDIELST